MRRRSLRRQDRRSSLFSRAARFVRRLFSSGPPSPGSEEDDFEGVGVRELRRPHRPSESGAVAREVPPDAKRDVRAIGEDRD